MPVRRSCAALALIGCSFAVAAGLGCARGETTGPFTYDGVRAAPAPSPIRHRLDECVRVWRGPLGQARAHVFAYLKQNAVAPGSRMVLVEWGNASEVQWYGYTLIVNGSLVQGLLTGSPRTRPIAGTPMEAALRHLDAATLEGSVGRDAYSLPSDADCTFVTIADGGQARQYGWYGLYEEGAPSDDGIALVKSLREHGEAVSATGEGWDGSGEP